jgi:hypothetical protein
MKDIRGAVVKYSIERLGPDDDELIAPYGAAQANVIAAP